MMDIRPTSLRLASLPQPARPIDGIDLWPALAGERDNLEREALLYFAEHGDLQCARLGEFKLHVARHNAPYFAPVPAIGRLNIPLTKPELYDLSLDEDESYDVANKYPDVVRDIRARIDRLMRAMPDNIQQHWRDTLSRKSREIPAGAWPTAQ